MNRLMENLMSRLVPVLTQEIAHFVRECMKWTLIGVVLFACMWFLTDGLPRLVVVINGLTPDHVVHSVATPLDAPHNLTHSR